MPLLASFVIYYHSSRSDNLEQTLRFLGMRERELLGNSELMLVCQDNGYTPDNDFAFVRRIDLGRDTYNKPLMNNIGVRESAAEVIVLLDSDRILPRNYFLNAVKRLQPRECISTEWLYKLKGPYADEDIDSMSCAMTRDFRTKNNEMHTKNMFSGNTVMRRKDYLDAGGMDESFEGYGYNDTDFTMTMTKWGANYVWVDGMELHLHHPPGLEGDEMIRSNVFNGIRYCNKWKLMPGEILKKRAAVIGVDLSQHVKRMKKHKRFI